MPSRNKIVVGILGLIIIGGIVYVSWRYENTKSTQTDQPTISSVFTNLDATSCEKRTDKSDPNETPYMICPGVGGYGLISRHVDSGRQSIDIVDPAQRVYPQNYHKFVTYMFSIDRAVEWRVMTKDGKKTPIALIVRMRVHGNNNSPEKITSTYLVVAKIQQSETCVTDRILEGSQSLAEIYRVADSAHERGCLSPQPSMD